MRMLKTAEYNELMENKRTLGQQIIAAETEKEYYDDMKDKADARKDKLELRMELYTNYMSEAIKEYEDAHPPEGG